MCHFGISMQVYPHSHHRAEKGQRTLVNFPTLYNSLQSQDQNAKTSSRPNQSKYLIFLF